MEEKKDNKMDYESDKIYRHYSHSWIFGCGCVSDKERYTKSEKIYNSAGDKYRLVGFVESRYYYIKKKNLKKKWYKYHVIHCENCSSNKDILTMYPKELICTSGVFMP